MLTKRSVFKGIANVATAGALLSLGALFSKHHWILDLISHFRVQYIVLLIPAFFIAAMVHKTTCLMIISFALAVHGYSVGLSVLPESGPVSNLITTTSNLNAVPTSATNDSVELTVLSSNLYLLNSNARSQLAIVKSASPDIIAFQEYTNEWHSVLSEALSAEYPHQSNIPTTHAFGIALYSKHPIISGGIERLSVNTPYLVNVEIDLGDRTTRVMSVHPDAPYSQEKYDSRNEFLTLLAEKISTYENAVIIAGDFNATPWTAHLSRLTSTARLRNARAGHGLLPTWPNYFFPISIPIDHILVNPRVAVEHFATEYAEGSDHRVVWAKLRVYK